MTVQIPLTRGLVAIVDDADVDVVTRYSWYAVSGGKQIWYAVRSISHTVGGGAQPMHSLITGYAHTDHINGDGLDNRRCNLRETDHSTNQRNSRKRPGTSSQFKGVSWDRRRRRWVGQIRRSHDQNQTHLGYFDDEEEAARAYDAAARDAFGVFASVNFPHPGERSAIGRTK